MRAPGPQVQTLLERHWHGRMTGAPPSYCFVALPPPTRKGHILFGKNSARPRDEVQEVLHVPASSHEAGSEVQCTYLAIDQVAKTHSVILNKPAWMWGAEMGANEYGVCIGNTDIVTKQAADDGTLLLGTDLVRLGLERGTSAKEAVDVITSLLEKHGQGGSNFHTDSQGFHSAFLIVDRVEAWILETVGKLWAAERITGGIRCICNHLSLKTHIDLEHRELRSHAQNQGWWNEDEEFNFSDVFSEHNHGNDCLEKLAVENKEELTAVKSMINVLRNKSSGICVDTDVFLTTASAVSVLPKDDKWPCIHFVTGTPDPSRADKVRLRRSRSVKTRRGRHLMKMGGAGPEPTARPPLGCIGGLSTALQNAVDKPLMPVALAHPRFWGSIFKPFIFVEDIKAVPMVQSSCVRDNTCDHDHSQWKHELYEAHQCALSLMDKDK
ncbi:unnamed protein product, partial [Ranitomeya imitator]